jgi:uncharacterized membrane protein required for colicin V production
MDFLKSLNWVDILMAALAVRIVYSGFMTGFVTEFMKTLAALLAVFVAFHYYIKLAEILGRYLALEPAILEAFVFAGIWLLVVVLMKFARDGILMVFTVQTVSLVDKWGAAVVSIVRFALTGSLLMFVFLVTDHPYMERMTRSSFAQKYLLSIAPDTYQKMTKGFVVKFFPNEKVNPAVSEELNESGRKK